MGFLANLPHQASFDKAGRSRQAEEEIASPLRLQSRGEKNGLPVGKPGKIRKRGDHPFNAHLYTDSSRSPPAHLT